MSMRDLGLVILCDPTSILRHDERLSAPDGRSRLAMAGCQDCGRQRVLPQRRDECDDVGEAR